MSSYKFLILSIPGGVLVIAEVALEEVVVEEVVSVSESVLGFTDSESVLGFTDSESVLGFSDFVANEIIPTTNIRTTTFRTIKRFIS